MQEGAGSIAVSVVGEQLRRRVPGGIGTYLRGLLGGLASLGTDVRVTRSVLPSPLVTRAWDHGLGGPGRRLGGGLRSTRSRTEPLRGVVHAPSLAVPPKRASPLTVMVHDLAWRHEPDAFPERGRRWHEAALGRALARADLLLVPSKDTADDLVAAGVATARIEIVEEGCDHLPSPDEAGAAALLQRLGFEADIPYMLTVSTLEPRKNLARLIEAHGVANRRLGDGFPLLVVGPPGWGPALAPTAGVVLAGPVDGGVLAGLYARARLLASVPLREGFGLPPLEAMRLGIPVVASPMPSTGGAAHEVSPLDVGAIADALVTVATDDALRNDLVAAGHERADHLTWRRAAARHVELWETLVR